MVTSTKRTISALLMALLVGTSIVRAQNEEILSPFASVMKAASQGGKFPIVINQHITHVQAPAQESSTALSSIGSFMKNVTFKGCSLAYKLGTTQAGLYCTSALLIGGFAYYNRKEIKKTVKDAHEKTREIIKQQIDALTNKLQDISENIASLKTTITQQNESLKGWFSSLLSSNQKELNEKLETIQQQLEKTLSEKKELQQQLETAQRENATLHKEGQTQIQKLDQKIEQHNKEYREKLAQCEESIKKLTEEIQKLVTRIGSPEKDSTSTIFGILKHLQIFGHATN